MISNSNDISDDKTIDADKPEPPPEASGPASRANARIDSKALGLPDLERAAHTLGVSLASVRAVTDVESRGRGFMKDGRPVILFERHVFWKRLLANGIDPTAFSATSGDVLSQKPGGYRGGAAEHDRLAAAALIDYPAAHESASWGAFQIMGFHWKHLGYATVREFISLMWRHEAAHLDAFVRFVMRDKGLLHALRTRNWPRFARGYNGPAYARNRYDAKLASAYEKHVRTEPARNAAPLLACNAEPRR